MQLSIIFDLQLLVINMKINVNVGVEFVNRSLQPVFKKMGVTS